MVEISEEKMNPMANNKDSMTRDVQIAGNTLGDRGVAEFEAC